MHGQQLQELCLDTKNWVYKAKLEECTNPRRALGLGVAFDYRNDSF